jgi:hypothetical protein
MLRPLDAIELEALLALCDVELARNEMEPLQISGLRHLRRRVEEHLVAARAARC